MIKINHRITIIHGINSEELRNNSDAISDGFFQGEQISEMLSSPDIRDRIIGELSNLAKVTLRVIDGTINITAIKDRTSYKGLQSLRALIPKPNLSSNHLRQSYLSVTVSSFGTFNSVIQYVNVQKQELVVLTLVTNYRMGQMLIERVEIS
ncbi:MAG: hypothetical protein LBC43_00825 [Bifidobacteriaceae bacterium]|jgi:hypothetical protein|nr:hypothetical protein [Bifidobacteriaceae bacterium]